MKTTSIKKSYIVIAAIIVIIGGYYWYKKTHATNQAVKYVTATAEKGTLTSSISGSGNIIVDQSSNIDPTITGTVTDLAVNVGDKVTKGQFLFNIDNTQLGVNVTKSTSSVTSAQSSVESAKAQLKQAQSDYNTIKDQNVALLKKQAAKEKLDAAKASVTSSQQNLVSAQADLANQQENAGKRRVTAPIDGTINAINIKNGDDLSKLSSGSSRQVPIIIGDLNTMKAQVQVNEVDIPNVTIGQKAMLTFSAIDGLNISGKVEKVDSLGTQTQGVVTYNVTIDLDTLDPRIKPEMSVSAAIITDVKQDVITVPNSAVKTQGGASYVEVMKGQTPQQVNVTVGTANNTDTEIVNGVNAGDIVVTQTINPNATTSSSSSSQNSAIRLPGVGGGGGNNRGFGR